jgi:hypothetical protein
MKGLSWRQQPDGSGSIVGPNEVELAHYEWQRANHPYFDRLRPLTHAGFLTNHAPYDHRWHHGLWWSWKFINDVLFWENHFGYGGAALGGTLADPALRSAQGVASLGAAATREANILAYNDVFLLISIVAWATLAWMVLHYLWQLCTVCRPAVPAQNAQTGMARVSLNNSGSQ